MPWWVWVLLGLAALYVIFGLLLGLALVEASGEEVPFSELLAFALPWPLFVLKGM